MKLVPAGKAGSGLAKWRSMVSDLCAKMHDRDYVSKCGHNCLAVVMRHASYHVLTLHTFIII